MISSELRQVSIHYSNREVWVAQRWVLLARCDYDAHRMPVKGQPLPLLARPKSVMYEELK